MCVRAVTVTEVCMCVRAVTVTDVIAHRKGYVRQPIPTRPNSWSKQMVVVGQLRGGVVAETAGRV